MQYFFKAACVHFLFLSVAPLFEAGAGCKEKEDPCSKCPEGTVCIDYSYLAEDSVECVPENRVIALGGTQIIVATVPYKGIVQGNTCLDTLFFTNNTALEFENPNRFGLYVNLPIYGGINVSPAAFDVVSDKEVRLFTPTEVCFQDGKALFATMHCIIEPDSVMMDIDLWSMLGSTTLVDSCRVTLYRN